MWRFEDRAGPAGGLPNKHNVTPMKPAPTRRKHRRLLPNKHYEAVPEEPEVEAMQVKPTNQVWTSTQTRIKPANCKFVLGLSSPAFPENPRDKTISPATPANTKSGHQVSSVHPAIQMTPDPEAFKTGEMPVKDQQNLAVTLESSINSSMELDTTFSSLPSPEIFREEKYEETSPFEEDLLGLHIKNSTLLDVSHAENICMYHPPNLSSLIDASTILIEKNSELSNHGVIEVKPKTHTDPFQSEKAFKKKIPSKPTIRRPILCKKVRFKSPITAESFEAKTIRVVKLTTTNRSEPVHWSSPTEQIQPDTDTSRADEISLKKVTLKRLVKSIPAQVKFFDFVSNGERDEFFQRERQRCARLQSFVFFPLTAAKRTEPALP